MKWERHYWNLEEEDSYHPCGRELSRIVSFCCVESRTCKKWIWTYKIFEPSFEDATWLLFAAYNMWEKYVEKDLLKGKEPGPDGIERCLAIQMAKMLRLRDSLSGENDLEKRLKCDTTILCWNLGRLLITKDENTHVNSN